MLILLPPSESKAVARRGRPLDLAGLSFTDLTANRSTVIDAAASASAASNAADILGVSPNLTDEIARNQELRTAPALPASRCYTGVLYDALDLASLGGPARARATRWIVVISALYGAVRLTDKIAPYRLSMGVNLPALGPLTSVWREVLDPPLSAAAGRGLIVDCRSSTYVAAWRPNGDLAARWVQIRVPGATHMAKYTRGLVSRAICADGLNPHSPNGLATGLAERFEVELIAPASARSPWTLDVGPVTPATAS